MSGITLTLIGLVGRCVPVPVYYFGLAQNSEIRIADVQGRVVYQTKSNGSKATWNGYRLDGTRPNSGVYFIFAINRDGSETALGKFVFIQ